MTRTASNQTARNSTNRNVLAGCLILLLLVCLALGLVMYASPIGRYFVALYESQAELSREISTLPTYKSLPVVPISAQNLDQVVEVKRLNTNNPTGLFAWSSDSRMLAIGYPRVVLQRISPGIDYFNVSEGRKLGSIALESSSQSIAFSSDGKLLALSTNIEIVIGSDNKSSLMGKDEIAIYDVASASRTRTFSVKADSIAISPDGMRLAAGMQGGKAILLDISSGQELRTFFPPPGLGGNPEASPTSSPTRTVGRDQKTLATFSPDRQMLALGYVPVLPADVAGVTIWDVETGTLVSSHSAKVAQVFRFTADGKKIITDSGILDIATGNLLGWGYGFGGSCSAISADGSVMAVRGMPLPDFSVDQPALVLRTSSGASTRGRELGRASVCPVSFSPDGRLLASGSGQIRLWGVPP